MKLRVKPITKDCLQECVDVYIDTFTREPWNDMYESREQVVAFFKNHLKNNYFLGYAGCLEDEVVALSIGMKKPWIKGMEYYIDEFCVCYSKQGAGIGSAFLQEIAATLEQEGLNGMMLNTEKGYPAEEFYLKNGFKIASELMIMIR